MPNPIPKDTMQKISLLHQWTLSPDPTDLYLTLLANMSDNDLVLATLVMEKGTPAGRLAWVEYARRRGYFEFQVRVVKMSGSIALIFDANAEPIHSTPIIRAKEQ